MTTAESPEEVEEVEKSMHQINRTEPACGKPRITPKQYPVRRLEMRIDFNKIYLGYK